MIKSVRAGLRLPDNAVSSSTFTDVPIEYGMVSNRTEMSGRHA